MRTWLHASMHPSSITSIDLPLTKLSNATAGWCGHDAGDIKKRQNQELNNAPQHSAGEVLLLGGVPLGGQQQGEALTGIGHEACRTQL